MLRASVARGGIARATLGALFLLISLVVTSLQTKASTYNLLVSNSATRSSPVALDGATVSDNIYVFVAPEGGASRVRFWLDNPSMTGTPTKSEGNAPWDFAGTNTDGSAKPYDTTGLSEGVHSITALVTLSAGGNEVITSTFTVANGSATSLVFTPGSLNFSAEEGTNPASRATNLTTSDGSTTAYTTTENASWLTLSPASGTTPASISAVVDTSGLGPGTYSTMATATGSDLQPAQLSVTLQITGGGTGSYDLLVSNSATRSSPVALDGATVSDNIYVFVAPEGGASRVRFWLDNPSMTGTPTKSEGNAPWDFAGTNTDGSAKPYDTTGLSEGVHSITALVDLAAGGTNVVETTFTVNNSVARPPDQIHLAWVEEPSTTLTLVWRTRVAGTPSQLQYRKAGTASWTSAAGSPRPSGTTGTLHEATLRSLTPTTSYEYRMLGDGGAWSSIYRTATAPSPGPASFDAIYFADTGLIGRTDGLATGTEQVISEIAALNPLVLLPGGDYAYFDTDKRYGSLNNTIDAWFNQVSPAAVQAPMMPTYGNHEALLGEGYGPWSDRFPTPEGYDQRRNYSFDIGDVHFLSIFAVQGFQGLSDGQLQWIEQDLASARARGLRWIIPYYHVSPFTDGTVHPANVALRRQLGPLFERYDVQIAISSHDQSYERSYPLTDVPNSNTRTSSSLTCYTMQDGVTWVKVSPGGKLSSKTGTFSPFASATPPAWTAFRDNTRHHFARLRVSASGWIRFEAFGVVGDGSTPVIMDAFEYRSGGC